LAGNISTYYYEAGHMMYVHIPSLKAQAKHLREFLKTAS
jgi:carboxypeptidase C (cathepsin A)